MGALSAYRRLSELRIGTVIAGERMARHTTFRIGGAATAYVECDSLGDLTTTLRVAEECSSRVVVIGRGSNLLVADEGYEGIVVVLGRDFKRFSYKLDPETGEPCSMVCGAGVPLARLVQESLRMGFEGFEFAAGIPGSFGGAVFMNAGVDGKTLGEAARSVVVYRHGAGLVRIPARELPWGYRKSGIGPSDIVLEAEVAIKPADKEQLRRRFERSLRRRKEQQPQGLPSAGSVFRNPEGASAGALIEEAGFKGRRVGGAQVSETHANFIVNAGDATARDVVELMTLVRAGVREASGIELVPEIRFLGFPR